MKTPTQITHARHALHAHHCPQPLLYCPDPTQGSPTAGLRVQSITGGSAVPHSGQTCWPGCAGSTPPPRSGAPWGGPPGSAPHGGWAPGWDRGVPRTPGPAPAASAPRLGPAGGRGWGWRGLDWGPGGQLKLPWRGAGRRAHTCPPASWLPALQPEQGSDPGRVVWDVVLLPWGQEGGSGARVMRVSQSTLGGAGCCSGIDRCAQPGRSQLPCGSHA